MTIDELIDQILTLLQREKRLSYRALKRRFGLDDDYLEDVKEEIIYAKKLAVDEDGRVLIWKGADAQVSTEGQAHTLLTRRPQHLTERILSSRSALEGERKQVTVLFVDIKDSTSLIEDLDPEEAQELLDGALRRMIDTVHFYEGTVNQIMGDGIMALFGAPVAHEDHAIRACYAAQGILASINDYTDEVRCANDIDLRIRVGLNSGDVVVRAIDNDLNMDYSAVGPTTHLAARMEQLATPGSCWMTDTTHQLVTGFVHVKELGPVQVRGLDEPVRAFELVGIIDHRRRLQVSVAHGLTPFVGRQAELGLLHRAQDFAETGHGQIVAVVGEAGVGKSRLMYEFIQSQRTENWLVMEGASASYRRATPYYAVIDLLKRYFQLQDGDEPQTVEDKVTGRVFELNPELQDTVPAVLALLDALPVDSQFLQLEPSHQSELICNALKRLLLCESQKRPILLVFEDLHWLDSESQYLLDGLLESVPTAHLLIVVSYRPQYQHTWGGRTFYSQLRLDPLPPTNADELLSALLGDDPSLEPLKNLLIERTEGNPFFIEESVRTQVEIGTLAGERGNYRLTKNITSIQIPVRVQLVIAARIDRLPFEEKRLLQCAAVIGKHVPFVLLKAIAGMSSDAIRLGLAHLQATEFLYETRLYPELEYTFKHAITHDVAYNGQLERQRRAYHAAVGFSLENLYEGRTDEVLQLLAYHFGRSEEDEKAVNYALLTADLMQRRWAHSEALIHFENALKRLERMPDNDSNLLLRIDAVLRQGEVKFALGMHAEHIEALESIGDMVKTVADSRRLATWYYWMGFLHSFTGSRPDTAISYCQEAAEIAEVGGFDDIRAFAESCLAQVYFLAGELQKGAVAGQRAIASFEARGNIWWACRTLWHLITVSNAMGKWRQSLDWCHRALQHGQEVDDLRLKVVGMVRMGSTYIQMGDPETGLQWCNEAQSLSPTPFDAAMVQAARGHGLLKIGEYEAAAAELTDSVQWFDQSNLRYTRSALALFLAEAYLRQEKRDQAREIIEEVLTTSREGGYRYLEGSATRLLGEVLATEDPAAATALLETAAQVLDEAGARNEYGKALVSLADLYGRAEDQGRARELIECAGAIFEELGTLDEPLRVQNALTALQRHKVP